MITLPLRHHETIEIFFEKGQSRGVLHRLFKCRIIVLHWPFKFGSDTMQLTKKMQYYSNSQKTDAKYI
jgi:hypothetical protein